MKDRAKTKEQLLSELAELHQRIPELEALETKHKRIEKALLASAQQWQRTFDAIGDVVCLQGAEGRILRCNTAMANLLGKSCDEIKDCTCWELMHGTSEPIEGCPIVRMRESHHRETLILPRGDRWLEDSVDPLLDENDNLIGAVHTISDITQRKRAEEALQESERRFSDVAENALEWIWEVDANGKYTYASPTIKKILGYEPKEMLNKHFYDLFHPEERDQLRQAAFKAFAKKEPFREFMNRNVHKNGEIVWLSTSGVPILNQKGDLIGYRGADADITERKQAEKALRESEERYRALVNLGGAVGEAIVMLQDTEQGDAIQTFVSDEWPHITGYSRKELLGMSFFDLLHPRYHQAALKRHKRKVSGETIPGLFEMSVIRKDGTEVPIELTSAYTTYKGERANVAFIRDITERKQAEEAIQESEERYRALVNLGGAVGEAIVMLQDTEQGDAIQTFVSDEWPHITGYSRKKLLGMSFFDLLHPKHREASRKRHKRKMGGEAIPELFELSIIRKDGSELPIEATSAYSTYKGERANVVFIRDITERKQAGEMRKELQQELYLSSRLAAIGRLAAGVAHQINNPLTGILGFSERLLRKSTSKEATRDLERIHSEAARTAKIVQNLLTFARRHKPKEEYSDINDILQKALELRAYELKTGNIEVALDLAPDLPQTMVDFHQIQEVFLNLILNAEQAMTETHRGGKLTIKTQQTKDYIRISFADDGPGIPAKYLDKLFDPFFTTRGEKGGTGLGLSVCHGIVTEHEGTIYAQNKPGKGTTFFVELPVTTEKADEDK